MALKKRNNVSKNASPSGGSLRPSDTGTTGNQTVRGVKSIDGLGSNEPDIGSNATSGGGPIETVRSGLSTMGNGITGSIKGLFNNVIGIGGKANAGVTKIAEYTNLPKAAVSVMLSVAILGTGGSGLTAYQSARQNSLLVRQEALKDDCAEAIDNMKTGLLTATNGSMDKSAQKLYSVGKALGMSNEQIAGMLGNAQRESQVDPTCIEGIYDEAYDINGARKKAAIANMNDYFTGTLQPLYARLDEPITLNVGAYQGPDGKYYCGIGLFQFTGPEACNLMGYAQSGNMDWWDTDLQLAFSFDTTGGYETRAQWVQQWIASGCSSPEQAAADWNVNFEGNSNGNYVELRQQYAREWFTKIQSGQLTYDAAYASSIISLANRLQGGALSAAVSAEESKCASAEKSYNNSDLARAAVAYAYETTAEGRGNDGTELYRFLHDSIFPGDTYYQSCDRGVATAINWSGADDSFPVGSTDKQDVYASSSSKWQDLGIFGSAVSYDQLQPGDVLITTSARRGSVYGEHGHIVMYVSNKIVQEKYPASSASFVSASIDKRSPGCETYSGQFVGENYHVYRNTQQESNPKWVDIAKGKNLDDGK